MNRKLCLFAAAVLLLSGAAHAYEVDGFRSARFGQKEADVLEAAAKDLGVKKEAFARKEDSDAGVTILSAKVQKFEPLDLPATVNYALGYKCKCLIQVSIVWSFPDKETEDMRRTALRGVGALAGKFVSEKWGEKETAVNRLPKDVKIGDKSTIIFFRGQNGEGGAITLAGGPVFIEKNKDASKTEPVANIDQIKTISLIYEQNATNPDIHRVDVSGF